MSTRSVVNALVFEAMSRALATYENPENRKAGKMLFPLVTTDGAPRMLPAYVLNAVLINLSDKFGSIPDGPVKKWVVDHTKLVLLKNQNNWTLIFQVV